MPNKYTEMYRLGAYESIINDLNPESDPNKDIPHGVEFTYAWSLYKFYLSRSDFSKRLKSTQFEYINNEIRRVMPINHMIIELIDKKSGEYYGSKGKPTITTRTYVKRSESSASTSSKDTYSSRDFSPETNLSYDDSNDYSYSREDRDYDDLTAIEQGNMY